MFTKSVPAGDGVYYEETVNEFGLRVLKYKYSDPAIQARLEPAFKVKITQVIRANNKIPKGNISFVGCEGNELNINLGTYNGDIEAAKASIQEFCNTHRVTYKEATVFHDPSDVGGTLSIDGRAETLTPYHIDIEMMLERIKRFSAASTQNQTTPPNSEAKGAEELKYFEMHNAKSAKASRTEITLKSLNALNGVITAQKWQHDSKKNIFWLRCSKEQSGLVEEQLRMRSERLAPAVSKITGSEDYCVRIKDQDLEGVDLSPRTQTVSASVKIT